jgi:hypothetical protein
MGAVMNGHLKRFERAKPVLEDFTAFMNRQISRGVPPQTAAAAYDRLISEEIWKNDEYQVNINKNSEHRFSDDTVVWHLSIKRIDKKPIHDWRDLQAIKTALVGPEFEAIELYPARKPSDGCGQSVSPLCPAYPPSGRMGTDTDPGRLV